MTTAPRAGMRLTGMADARRAGPSFEPEPQRGDAEERKESDDIRHRGHNTPDEIAGLAWKRRSTSGTRMPPSAPARRLQIMARPITRPRPGTLNHAAAATPVMTAKAKPLTNPTSTSRRMMRAALALEKSCVAGARTATVMV